MANSIALAQKYAAKLDEVYKQATKTGDLTDNGVQILDGNTVKVFKIDMDGLGDYDRQNGFLGGDVTGSWETMTLSQDRGRSFTIDSMDNEETLGLSIGKLGGEFVRTQVVPESDAYILSKIAGTAGISTTSGADITVGTTDCPALVDAAMGQLDDDNVPEEGRILYVSNEFYRGLQAKLTRTIQNDVTGINRTVEYYGSAKVVKVPSDRLYTAITLKTGKSGQEEGGYTKASGAKKINFLLVAPSAVAKVVKLAKNRLFTPDENQQADGWKYDYRLYYDVFVYDNKVKGIYLHKSSTDAT